ncbi:MAG: sigma 54-interacting transcriptional regulator [Desulfobacteraceae bacterium]|jgi:transcriptional regulator with GAF, ATPase, and Fis domain
MAVNENEFFRQATLRICRHLDIEKGLSACLHYLSTIMPADMICLEIYEPDIRALRIFAKASLAEYRKTDLLIPMDQKARGMMEKIYRRFKNSRWPDAVVINDPDADPVAPLVLEMLQAPGSALMHMVLETEGRPLCSLMIVAQDKQRFTDEDARLLSLLKEPFSVAMANALKHREVLHFRELLADDNRFLQRQLLGLSGDQIIGADFGLKSVMEKVRQVAAHDSPVLLLGETGTGKDVLANAIHYSSARREAAFIAVNCGAIPENLMDSELFGHEKGAFTGALAKKRGRFERANNGTVFLDEIGDLPPQAQVRMLRVLQNHEIERLGGTRRIPLDIRVIAATNKNLEEMIAARQFREDLWFRLNVFPIQIPPLRERKEDVPALVRHFIAKKAAELKLPAIPKIAPGAIDRLLAYAWPGNVRELENIVERALIVNPSESLTFDEIGLPAKTKESIRHRTVEGSLPPFDEMVSAYIKQVLDATNGKIHGPGGAAEVMAINPSTLRSKISKLGIHYTRKVR